MTGLKRVKGDTLTHCYLLPFVELSILLFSYISFWLQQLAKYDTVLLNIVGYTLRIWQHCTLEIIRREVFSFITKSQSGQSNFICVGKVSNHESDNI